MSRNQWHIGVHQRHLCLKVTKELHTRPYMVTKRRCVWTKHFQWVISCFITTRNEAGARLYFHSCLWFCPQGVCSQGCCGWYTSYWNAFLFRNVSIYVKWLQKLVMSMWDEILTDRSFLDTYHITHLCSVKWRFFKENIIKILNQKVKYLPVNSNNPNIFPTLGIKHFRHGCTSDKGIFTN